MDCYGQWDKDLLSGKAQFWFPNTDSFLASGVSGDWDHTVLFIFFDFFDFLIF
jgi:hypothetical protein